MSGTFEDGRKRHPRPIKVRTLMNVDSTKLTLNSGLERIIFNSGEGTSSSDCSDGLCGPVFNASGIITDDKYPEEYLKLRDSWIEEFKDVEAKFIPPPVVGAATAPKNPSQVCNFDSVYGTQVVSVDTKFAKDKIAEVCMLFKDVPLDGSKQTEVIMPYETVGVQMYAWAAWNRGDPQCATSRSIEEEHCVDMLNKVINECPSDNDLKTYGGSRVDKCIVYGLNAQRRFTLPPKVRKGRS